MTETFPVNHLELDTHCAAVGVLHARPAGKDDKLLASWALRAAVPTTTDVDVDAPDERGAGGGPGGDFLGERALGGREHAERGGIGAGSLVTLGDLKRGTVRRGEGLGRESGTAAVNGFRGRSQVEQFDGARLV